MPYTVIDNAEGCSGYAVVKEGETVPVGGGCHALKSDAIIHMVALQSEYMEEEVEDEDEEERQAPNLIAPAFMKASARRGLELHKEGFSGDGLKPQTVADARKMAEGTALSEDKWRRIAPWLARHIGDLDAVQGDEVTPGLVAMLLWGGGSSKSSARRAQDYAERIVAQLDAEGSQRDVVSSDTMATDMTQSDNQVPEAAPEVRHAGWVTRSDDARSIAYTNLEVRALEDKNTLVGYAAVFDSPSEPMPYTEFVRRGAFAKTLNDGADVRLLIDHEGVPLARTKSGTLALEEDERGLRVEAELDPENPDAARVLSAMRRGDLSQMSFAFRTVKDSYNEDRSVRELKEVQLFDVSIVTFPAYEETVAELRSRNQTAIVEVASSILLRKNQVLIAKHKQP